MKGSRFAGGFVAGVAATAFCLASISTVRAFNPQPDPPGNVHRLEAVVNMLSAANAELTRVDARTAFPPDPYIPAIRSALSAIQAKCSETDALVTDINSKLPVS